MPVLKLKSCGTLTPGKDLGISFEYTRSVQGGIYKE